ncbi:hypothetical protein RJT34_13477 [Clitoria ternatea]|uniref:Uncharacterized protein n=1 Tax=Clitoria ternatea TaxID=43366 RepID=A0AAN9PK83_CLITE
MCSQFAAIVFSIFLDKMLGETGYCSCVEELFIVLLTLFLHISFCSEFNPVEIVLQILICPDTACWVTRRIFPVVIVEARLNGACNSE